MTFLPKPKICLGYFFNYLETFFFFLSFTHRLGAVIPSFLHSHTHTRTVTSLQLRVGRRCQKGRCRLPNGLSHCVIFEEGAFVSIFVHWNPLISREIFKGINFHFTNTFNQHRISSAYPVYRTRIPWILYVTSRSQNFGSPPSGCSHSRAKLVKFFSSTQMSYQHAINKAAESVQFMSQKFARYLLLTRMEAIHCIGFWYEDARGNSVVIILKLYFLFRSFTYLSWQPRRRHW